MPSPQIFISYRIADTRDLAGRLHTSLNHYFGDGTVFRDKEEIKAGIEWSEEIEKQLLAAKVVLILIKDHSKWFGGTGANRRIDDPGDVLRLEIETALNKTDTLIIPVLFDSAVLPKKEDLPGTLQRLLTRQKWNIRTDYWENDLKALLETIGQKVPRKARPYEPGLNTPKIFKPAHPLLRWLWRNYRLLDFRKSYFKSLQSIRYGRSEIEGTLKAFIVPSNFDCKTELDIANKINPANPHAVKGRWYVEEKGKTRAKKKHLLNFFLKGLMQLDHCFVLVRADSGIGKTTFLQKLFCDYARVYPSENLAFVYAGERTVDRIAAIENKEKTILFLDALDEDDTARKDLQTCVEELSPYLKEFQKIIVTTRLQLLGKQEDWNSFGGVDWTAVVDMKEFTEPEAVKYITAKYQSRTDLRNKAIQIFGTEPRFFTRPLLLSWFDYILASERIHFDYLFEVYETVLQELWAEREEKVAESTQLQKRKYSEHLLAFSKAGAHALFSSKKDNFSSNELSKIAGEYEIPAIDARTRSFFSRSPESEVFTFTHRSLFDYFLARLLFDHDIPEEEFPFQEYHGTAAFYEEMCWLHYAGLPEKPRDRSNATLHLSDDRALQAYAGSELVTLLPNWAIRAMLIRHKDSLVAFKDEPYWFSLMAWLAPRCEDMRAANHPVLRQYSEFKKALDENKEVEYNPGSYLEHFFAEYVYEEVLNLIVTPNFEHARQFGKNGVGIIAIFGEYEKRAYHALLPKAYPVTDFGITLGIVARNEYLAQKFAASMYWDLQGVEIQTTEFLNYVSVHLRTLRLVDCALTAIPTELFRFKDLHTLMLNSNRITSGPLTLKPLLEMPELETLMLWGNPLSGVDASWLGTPEGSNCLRVLRERLLWPPELLEVEGGRFLMGQDTLDVVLYNDGKGKVIKSLDREMPVHWVRLRKFAIGKYPVTLGEFRMFIEQSGYITDAEQEHAGSNIWNEEKEDWELQAGVFWRHDVIGNEQYNDRHPVIHVSWNDAVAYCNWLSDQYGYKRAYKQDPTTNEWHYDSNSNGYRLLTEAEWEYAAREGGKDILFGNGKNMADPAEINFDGSARWKTEYSVAGEYRGKTTPVGYFPPNALTLYDMSGNVNEWCWDWYDTYPAEEQFNPIGPKSGADRVLRGGSWYNSPGYCRVADRINNYPGYRFNFSGFRLARTL